MKVFKWVFCFCVLAAVIIIGVIRLPALSSTESAEAAEPGPGKIILYVNGEPVTRQEFQLYMDKERGSVTNYFSVQHNAEDRGNYWTTEFGGERPIDKLKSRAAEEAAKGKLLQTLALGKGVAKHTGFEQLLKDWADGNKQREQEIGSGKAIFGLGQYNLSQYYFYMLSNLKLELEELLGKSELQVTAEDIKRVYKAHAKDYQNRTRLDIEVLSVPYAGEEAKSQALQAIQAAHEQLQGGESPEQVTQSHTGLRLLKNTAIVDNQTNPLSSEAVIIQTAMKLEKGSYSTIGDMGDSYSIVKLVDKTENYAVPIEEVESQLKAEALSLKFADYLEQQYSQSDVKLEQGNYDAIAAP
ncbi:peptidyl-prolyl cis-trans isomerase [Paenibacillus sp. HW567]|uniref:peptidylprolyl isomerase n=1 Tax=Paenibacillus sp. HW567 TaxID=1034769 RepID=UPI0003815B41|nr:peptidylprolyl isomerase [Paenibacillus sp. HW567]